VFQRNLLLPSSEQKMGLAGSSEASALPTRLCCYHLEEMLIKAVAAVETLNLTLMPGLS